MALSHLTTIVLEEDLFSWLLTPTHSLTLLTLSSGLSLHSTDLLLPKSSMISLLRNQKDAFQSCILLDHSAPFYIIGQALPLDMYFS